MRVLVTGGCGFIGVNLVNRLARTDAQILVVDNQSAGSRKDLEDVIPTIKTLAIDSVPAQREKGVWFIPADIRDRAAIERITSGLDAIVHLAAHTEVVDSVRRPDYDMEVNVLGTLNLLEGARLNQVKRFILASSAAAFGEQEPPLDEQKPVRPTSPYGASKVAGEAYCSAYRGSYGIETVALRFSNVYGPRSFHKGSVIALFIRRLLDRQPLVIYGDGNQTRDFLYVEDLVDAICACLSLQTGNIGGEVFQIATGKETSVNQVAAALSEIASESGFEAGIRYSPARPGEIYRNYASIEKAKRLLAYDPRTDLRTGIRTTWEWFLSKRGLS